MERRTYALLLRYDGSAYKGWQLLPDLPTVCGELTSALRKLKIGATPYGASRTDAGVHARAQVVTFHSRADHDPDRLEQQLNANLPPDVRVLAVRAMPRSFHAHWSSTGKRYRYRISFADEPKTWRLPSERFPFHSLDPARLHGVLGQLSRAEDLSALCADKKTRARTLAKASILSCDPTGASLEFEGPGFGKYMVRNLVSLVAEVAAGALEFADVERILAREQRRPLKADAGGLTLWQVLYPPAADPFPDLEALCVRPGLQFVGPGRIRDRAIEPGAPEALPVEDLQSQELRRAGASCDTGTLFPKLPPS